MALANRLDGLRARFPRLLPRAGKWRTVLLVLVVLLALVTIGSFFIDEPLRQYVERRMNSQLQGYTVSIGRLSFHPLGFSTTFRDLVFIQDVHPDPPVLSIPRMDASVQWRALLHLAVVANFVLDQPALYVNQQQLMEEAKDSAPVTDRGWQDAFQAAYPLEINEFKVVDGEVTYVDDGPFKPLELHRVNIKADNIRNIKSRERTYPSELHFDAVVFQSGKIVLDGNADFLADPYPGVKADVVLEGIELDYFKPIVRRENLDVRGGTLSASGAIEYAATIAVVDLAQAVIRGVRLDYIHRTARADVTTKAAVAVQSTGKVANKSDLYLRAREVRIADSEVGIVNKTTTPEYRMFLSKVDLTLTNVTNQRPEGATGGKLRGRFMGSGDTTANVTVRANPKGPDYDLRVAIENTDMKTMNDILRAHASLDVVAGTFSFYSELAVRDGWLQGYLKPLFKDVHAYGREQDREKTFGQKLKEKLIRPVAKLLENQPRDEVATRVEVKGRVDDPQYSVLQVAGKLLQNAFIKAILPGLEREVRQARVDGGAKDVKAGAKAEPQATKAEEKRADVAARRQ